MKKLWALFIGLIVGAAISMCAGFVQGDRTVVHGHQVYYGVPLSVAIVAGVLLWLNRFFQSRVPGVGILVAWVLVTWQLTVETFGGDIGLVPAVNVNAYLIAASLCLGVAAAAPIFRPLQNEFIQPLYQSLEHGDESE